MKQAYVVVIDMTYAHLQQGGNALPTRLGSICGSLHAGTLLLTLLLLRCITSLWTKLCETPDIIND
jgi:hypothetical protein